MKNTKPGTLATYRNKLKRYFLLELFDTGENEELETKMPSKQKNSSSLSRIACDTLDKKHVKNTLVNWSKAMKKTDLGLWENLATNLRFWWPKLAHNFQKKINKQTRQS